MNRENDVVDPSQLDPFHNLLGQCQAISLDLQDKRARDLVCALALKPIVRLSDSD